MFCPEITRSGVAAIPTPLSPRWIRTCSGVLLLLPPAVTIRSSIPSPLTSPLVTLLPRAESGRNTHWWFGPESLAITISSIVPVGLFGWP